MDAQSVVYIKSDRLASATTVMGKRASFADPDHRSQSGSCSSHRESARRSRRPVGPGRGRACRADHNPGRGGHPHQYAVRAIRARLTPRLAHASRGRVQLAEAANANGAGGLGAATPAEKAAARAKRVGIARARHFFLNAPNIPASVANGRRRFYAENYTMIRAQLFSSNVCAAVALVSRALRRAP